MRVFNAGTVNADFGCVEWPGGVDLCPDAMHQAMTGSESVVEICSAAALRKDAKKNQWGNQENVWRGFWVSALPDSIPPHKQDLARGKA